MNAARVSMEDALSAVKRARRDADVVITTMAAAKVWMDLGPAHPLDLVFVPSCRATQHRSGLA